MAVRGKMALVVFDDTGKIEHVVPFGAGYDVAAIDLPSGKWHTLIVLESGSIFFETKPGPYAPLSDKDFAPWSPPENSPDVNPYLSALTKSIADYL